MSWIKVQPVACPCYRQTHTAQVASYVIWTLSACLQILASNKTPGSLSGRFHRLNFQCCCSLRQIPASSLIYYLKGEGVKKKNKNFLARSALQTASVLSVCLHSLICFWWRRRRHFIPNKSLTIEVWVARSTPDWSVSLMCCIQEPPSEMKQVYLQDVFTHCTRFESWGRENILKP